jgi:hypothetical protein
MDHQSKYRIWRANERYQLQLRAVEIRPDDRIKMKSGRWVRARDYKPYVALMSQPAPVVAPAPELPKFVFNIDPAAEGLKLSATMQTALTTTNVGGTVPWLFVVAGAAGFLAGTAIAQLKIASDEKARLAA